MENRVRNMGQLAARVVGVALAHTTQVPDMPWEEYEKQPEFEEQKNIARMGMRYAMHAVPVPPLSSFDRADADLRRRWNLRPIECIEALQF